MSMLGFGAAVLALGIFLWRTGIYLPVDREGEIPPDRSDRDAAVPVPVPCSGTKRPRGEMNPPATLRTP